MAESSVSAQVLLRSASGRVLDGDVAITSANVGDYAPAPEDVLVAQRALRGAGFEVGAMIGISFSITAPAPHFEDVFGVPLRVGHDGGVRRQDIDASDSSELELPLRSLPPEVRAVVSAITFTPPAELFSGGAMI